MTTKKDNHYAAGPPFDAVSAVGRLQVVGEILFVICVRCERRGEVILTNWTVYVGG